MHICIENRGETVPTSKIRRKKEEVPRNPKKIVNVWESPFGKVVAEPFFMLGEHQSREIFRLRVRVSFSVFQMVVAIQNGTISKTLPQNEVDPVLLIGKS